MRESCPASVEVRTLTKRYGTVEAVRDVSFDVAGGEIFGLLGRNGAGKTTTLECLLALRRPDFGTVRIDGIDALAEPDRAKAILGAQLQISALPDKITPREALRFTASFYSDPLPIAALLERFALTPKADASFDSLSGGQKQRLFLALAFVHRPRVVVLDEPTVGLDPQARREFHAAIRELKASGVTVLLSTHYLEEAEQLCDRVGILDAGRLVAAGTPAELVSRSRTAPRIAFRAANPVDRLAIKSVAGGIADCREVANEWVVDAGDINAAIVAIVQHLATTGNALVDLRVQRPTLEDAFVELAGAASRLEDGQ